MVLFPIEQEKPLAARLSAWEAIERSQRAPAKDWWLVAQPDHAALSGELARQIDSPFLPSLDDESIRAISLHDDGWAAFDNSVHLNSGRPMSFLEAPVKDFLRAWDGSIEHAEKDSEIGGLMVSEHFCRIARVRPPGADQPLIDNFLQKESGRQDRLRRKQARTAEEINLLVDVLQFCDLLSLYLCCGSRNDVEFPQKFKGQSLRLRREGELCRMEPPILGPGASLAVMARRFSDASRSLNIPVLLG